MGTGCRWTSASVLKDFLLVAWLTGCGLLFWRTYHYYRYEPSFYYVHEILGSCLCISRASAAVLNLTCGMAVLPMCRITLTALRRINIKIKMRTVRVLLDSHKGFHICCAYIIVAFSAVHFTAHMVNARNFSMYYNPVYTNVNAAVYKNQDPLWIILRTVPGVTGLMMMLLLSLMISSSVTNIRRNDYDLFWYSHRLFVPFYTLLVIHSVNGPIRKQTNLGTHTPGCPFKNLTSTNGTIDSAEQMIPEPEPEYDIGSSVCADEPMFTQIGCYSWLWVSGPLLVYLCDTVYRYTRRLSTVKLISVTEYPCDMIKIEMQRPGFKPKVGQFILVQCPQLSALEWHPFSITMCPTINKSRFSVHIRTRGDWSDRLKNALVETDTEFGDSEDPHLRNLLRVDGPFCSPMEDVSKYRVVVCAAGGIGITPFISMINAIRDGDRWTKELVRVLLIWVYRDSESCLWFVEEMKRCQTQCWNLNKPDLLDIRLFCTGDQKQQNCVDSDDFIKKRLHLGRPNWEIVLQQVLSAHKRLDVGMFACGPHSLITDVSSFCYKAGCSKLFFYHESY